MWKNWEGVDDEGYAVHNVLIPEVVVRLVMEDMALDVEGAMKVMEESKEYGQMGNSRVL
jgi:hypothetical protein